AQQRPPIRAVDRLAEQADLAAVGARQAEQHADRRGLPGAVGAEEPVDAAGRHAQAQVVDRAHVSIVARQSGRLDGEVGHRRLPAGSRAGAPAPPSSGGLNAARPSKTSAASARATEASASAKASATLTKPARSHSA